MVTMHISQYNQYLNSRFCIWKHSDSNPTTVYMQKLVDVPKVPVIQLYKYVIVYSEPIIVFEINRNMEEGPLLTWKLLTHLGIYIGTIGMILAICEGIYCLKRSWFRPATPGH